MYYAQKRAWLPASCCGLEGWCWWIWFDRSGLAAGGVHFLAESSPRRSLAEPLLLGYAQHLPSCVTHRPCIPYTPLPCTEEKSTTTHCTASASRKTSGCRTQGIWNATILLYCDGFATALPELEQLCVQGYLAWQGIAPGATSPREKSQKRILPQTGLQSTRTTHRSDASFMIGLK